MPLTEKQRDILLNNGWTEQDLSEVPYDEASDAIGEILARRKPGRFRKTARQQPTAEKYQPYDKVSYYVSYAKDLCIAMLQAHVEARKLDNKIELIEIGKLMTAAVEAIKQAKKQFE